MPDQSGRIIKLVNELDTLWFRIDGPLSIATCKIRYDATPEPDIYCDSFREQKRAELARIYIRLH